MVRAAVLKGKDPAQILEEMEKIDEMGEHRTCGRNIKVEQKLIFPSNFQNIMSCNHHP